MILFRFAAASLVLKNANHQLLVLSLITGTLAFTAPTALPAQTITYDTIALTGDAVPGAEPGVVFSGFDAPVLNGPGQTAFRASLTDMSVNGAGDRGILIEDGGTLRLVVRSGNEAPGTGLGVVFGDFGTYPNPVLNDNGQVAFYSGLSGPNVDRTKNSSIYTWSNGTLELVAREGNVAPGTEPGIRFGDFGVNATPTLDNTGQVLFRNTLTGSGVLNDIGYFSRSDGALRLIARSGQPAPDLGPDESFTFLSVAPVPNNSGQLAFRASLTGTGSSIIAKSGGTLSLIAHAGEPAPDTESGVFFSSLFPPALNDAGEIAFNADLSGSNVDINNSQAMFSNSGGTLRLIARSGSPAPSVAPDVNFSFFEDPAINNTGQTAFRAQFIGTGENSENGVGIFTESGGELNLVARSGDAVPESGPNVTFFALSSPFFNDAGQVSFEAVLSGSGTDSSNNRGIFATDPTGTLRLVARTGDIFDVNPDPLVTENRMISGFRVITPAFGSDIRLTSFNDAGQLAFKLSFADGTEGVFVATIIPEPKPLVILGMGSIVLLGHGRALIRAIG